MVSLKSPTFNLGALAILKIIVVDSNQRDQFCPREGFLVHRRHLSLKVHPTTMADNDTYRTSGIKVDSHRISLFFFSNYSNALGVKNPGLLQGKLGAN